MLVLHWGYTCILQDKQVISRSFFFFFLNELAFWWFVVVVFVISFSPGIHIIWIYFLFHCYFSCEVEWRVFARANWYLASGKGMFFAKVCAVSELNICLHNCHFMLIWGPKPQTLNPDIWFLIGSFFFFLHCHSIFGSTNHCYVAVFSAWYQLLTNASL